MSQGWCLSTFWSVVLLVVFQPPREQRKRARTIALGHLQIHLTPHLGKEILFGLDRGPLFLSWGYMGKREAARGHSAEGCDPGCPPTPPKPWRISKTLKGD